MTKSVFLNFKRWTTDEKRLLVVFLLTLIYPVFVTSFYALYLFVLMPVMVPLQLSFKEAHHALWYHFYWLFVSLLWLFLCILILPFFKKKSVQHAVTMSNIESSPLLQPAVRVEIKKEDSQSNLSQKSENSSDNIKKAISDSLSEKESLGKSKESISKSITSMERKKLTQSGEFLNDFMSTIDSEDVKKNETVCEIHAEKSKDEDNGNIEKEEVKLMDEQDHQSEKDIKNGETHERKSKTSESSCSDKEEPFISTQKTKPLQTLSPLKVNEPVYEQHNETEESEMIIDKIESDLPNKKRVKAIPKIDTSRASGYYECSMPTPMSVESHGSQNNTVFLFINPETETTEDDILVVHGGKKEDSADEKIDP